MIVSPKYRFVAGVTLIVIALLAIWLAPATIAGLTVLAGAVIVELAGAHLVSSLGEPGKAGSAVDR